MPKQTILTKLLQANAVSRNSAQRIAGPRSGSPRGPAGRSGNRNPARRPAPRKSASRRPSRGPILHAPSFSAGVVLGAIIVLTAAYAPEFFTSSPTGDPGAAAAPSPEVTFEFDNLLRNSQVTTNPEAYAVEDKGEEAGSIEYLIQAASFRSEADAETLRARLLLQDLPAHTTSTQLNNSVWYRVTVGPFDSQVPAQRAMTRLREQKLDALWIRRRKPT